MDRPDNYESLTTLDISTKGLTELPSWVSECKKLEKLYCYNNKIIHLDNLPQTLKYLDCCYNNITHLDNLPQTLEELKCSGNNITQFDNLPITLIMLQFWNNPLKYNFEPTLENIRNYINQNTKIN